ncbi:hypothetical protein [Pantanalinema sp. GBBB05]|uniref:hypothetical protein n=1 Tax=Pantanalinema sp. GBBB05 TaxID=2604139 RepID=UPI001DE1E80B|nr:hypothetical protein [Pantanalinema sp. GBBB05]
MNTPSHAVINLALLMGQPQMVLPIAVGAVLPDVPMFVMYAWAKGVQQQSERQIWTGTYWHPQWQLINHSFHSIPLAAIATTVAYFMDCQAIAWLGLSMVLHSLGDLPVHHDDAHRHWLPFSHYRWISPLSYWDPRHHGTIVAVVEKLLVLVASIYLFPVLTSWVARSLLVGINLLYWSGYFYRLWHRKCGQIQTQNS